MPSWAIVGLVLVAVVVALYFVGNSSNSSKPGTTAGVNTSIVHRHPRRTRHRAATPAALKPTTVKLELVPTGSVYVCLVDGTGKQLIPGRIFAAGETIPTQTAPKMMLTLGNASVRMKVNGKLVHVSPSASSIGFLLQPSGQSPLAPAQQPRCA